MSLGNGELTNANKSVHLARILVTEERGGLAKAHGEIAVGAFLVKEYLILEGAGHGAESQALLRFIVRIAENEHTVKVVIPVPRNAIEVALCHKGSFGKKVAAAALLILNEALKHLNGLCALGEHYGKSLTDTVYRGEVFKLASDLIVVALLCLLNGGKVCVHLLLGGVRNTVNALEHLVGLIALPIRARALRELDGANGSRGEKVRACAEVGELALTVEADHCIVGKLLDKLNLIRLILFGHKGDSLGARKLKTLDLKVFAHDLLHLVFDILKNILRKGDVAVKIVIVAVVDGRSNGELGFGIKALYCLRENVGCSVAVNTLALVVGKGVKNDVIAVGDGGGHSHSFAVKACGDMRSLGNARLGCGLENRCCVFYGIVCSVDLDIHDFSPWKIIFIKKAPDSSRCRGAL